VELRVGQAVWVRVIASGDDGPVAAGEVLAVASDRIGIRFREQNALLPGCIPGCIVALRVLSDAGSHIAHTVVLRAQSKPHVIIAVRPPVDFSTVPHRKFFRVPAKFPVVCRITASAQQEAVGSVDSAAKTQNISAGGVALLTALALRVGDQLVLSLTVPSLRAAPTTLELAGHVLRLGSGERKPRITLSAGIKFAHRNQREEDALVRLMFDLQRKSLQ
jgi:c-di-GMP-binding flagellar brake protein YcgR